MWDRSCKGLGQVFLCDGQGAARGAILYADSSYYSPVQKYRELLLSP